MTPNKSNHELRRDCDTNEQKYENNCCKEIYIFFNMYERRMYGKKINERERDKKICPVSTFLEADKTKNIINETIEHRLILSLL